MRALAADLKIHPNTAHKVVQHLIQERWLETRPGDRQRLLEDKVGKLVMEARRVDANLDEAIAAIRAGWKDMRGNK